MKIPFSRTVVMVCAISMLAVATTAAAQTGASAPDDGQPAAAPPATPAKGQSFFKTVAHDYKSFFSKDTAKVLGMMSVASIAAVPWDREGLREGLELPAGFFKPGKYIGNVLYEGGFGVLVLTMGKMTDSDKAADLGRDIVRGQLLSQGLVQALKYTIRRQRPDGSNHAAFPSGHSASTFTTAAILQRHFGWKVATPMYVVGGYVAMSRMSANKHHISDVVMGAGIGLAAGRTVTIHTIGQKMGVGVTPVPGGASLTFTHIPK